MNNITITGTIDEPLNSEEYDLLIDTLMQLGIGNIKIDDGK